MDCDFKIIVGVPNICISCNFPHISSRDVTTVGKISQIKCPACGYTMSGKCDNNTLFDRWYKKLHAKLSKPIKSQRVRWISCLDSLPKSETSVLIIVNGELAIGELVWENPDWEFGQEPFLYWDSPTHDGQCWEWYDVTHWMDIELPEIKKHD